MTRGALLALLLIASSVRADETCMSPYMPKITGREDWVYVWTLGVDGLGDGPFNISPGTDSQAKRIRLQADMQFKF